MRGEQHAHANLQAELANQKWYSFLSEPSEKWGEVKCHMFIHFFAAFVMFATGEPECGIQSWLMVYFILMFCDNLMREMFLRMRNSIFWGQYRKLRKYIQLSSTILKEIFEASWIIYGCTIDKSKCKEEDTSGLNVIMIIFQVLGFLKIALYVCFAVAFAVAMVARRRQNRA